MLLPAPPGIYASSLQQIRERKTISRAPHPQQRRARAAAALDAAGAAAAIAAEKQRAELAANPAAAKGSEKAPLLAVESLVRKSTCLSQSVRRCACALLHDPLRYRRLRRR